MVIGGDAKNSERYPLAGMRVWGSLTHGGVEEVEGERIVHTSIMVLVWLDGSNENTTDCWFINEGHWFVTILEADKSNIMVLTGLMSGEGLVPGT